MKNIEICKEVKTHEDAVKNARMNMISTNTLYDVAELFKVFGDSTRISILWTLSQGELCVCDISEVLNMSISAVSHQLRILRHNKLIKSRKSGKEVYYSLADDHVEKVIEMAIEHINEYQYYSKV